MMDAAAACTGHLMVVVLKRGGLHMAETMELSSREHYKGRRRLHVAEGGGGVAAVDGYSGSSQHCGVFC